MSRAIDLLCLARSTKHGDRCVAGVSIEDGEWVRPVSALDDGRLRSSDCLTTQGHVPEPLDTVRVFVESHAPEGHQPENWRITDRTWEMVDRGRSEGDIELLAEVFETGPEIFGDTNRRIPHSQVEQSSVDGSLSLVAPTNTDFDSTGSSVRVKFTLDGARYNLSLTDLRWSQKIRQEDLDYGPATAFLGEHDDLLFTVSLGTEHEGAHYKIAAGVVPVTTDEMESIRNS